MTLTRITTAINTNTNVTATKVNTSVCRFGNRWNVNECLRLQREYELLKLSVPEIAALHGRTIKAIIYKISAEGFASFNDLFVQTYGNYSDLVQDHIHEQVLDQEQVLEQDQVLELDPAFESDATDSELDLDDLNLDEDYVPDEHSDSTDSDNDYEDDDEDEGSNKHYLYSQVKSMQKQISAILGYLTKGAAAPATTTATTSALDSYGGV
jgi:hypothetical protein